MKSFVVLALIAMAALVLAHPDKYTDRYDNVNLDEILANQRLLVPYIKCILDEGRCSPDGKELKSHIVDALENRCEKCTDKQKAGSKRVIGHLINKEPEHWQQLVAKYDPNHKYVKEYETELKEVKA